MISTLQDFKNGGCLATQPDPLEFQMTLPFGAAEIVVTILPTEPSECPFTSEIVDELMNRYGVPTLKEFKKLLNLHKHPPTPKQFENTLTAYQRYHIMNDYYGVKTEYNFFEFVTALRTRCQWDWQSLDMVKFINYGGEHSYYFNNAELSYFYILLGPITDIS